MPEHSSHKPSAWVERWATQIPATGRILDLACGSGRHLRLLSNRDQPLVGIDIDLARVADLADLADQANLQLVELDLEQPGVRLPHADYAGIVVTNYLHRPLLDQLPAYLEPNGILIYETFALGNEQYGRPRNPDFLLKPGELLALCAGQLEVLGFEQGLVETPAPAVIQRICARKSA